MTFPGAYASVYRNEAGEVLGWDNHYYDEPEYDPDDFLAGDYDNDDDGEEDWYVCDDDGKEFRSLDAFDAHRKREHGDPAPVR